MSKKSFTLSFHESSRIWALVNNGEMPEGSPKLTDKEKDSIGELLQQIDRQAVLLKLSKEKAKLFINDILGIYSSTRHAANGLTWGIINPTKKMSISVATKNVKTARKGFVLLSEVPDHVLMTLFSVYSNKQRLSGLQHNTINAARVFRRESFRVMVEICDKELEGLKATGKSSRHSGVVRAQIVDQLICVWRNDLNQIPKYADKPPFTDLVMALFESLGFEGKTDPKKLIVKCLKKYLPHR